jgi:hypothetical protein
MSFLKLNSSPIPNKRNITPISAQIFIFSASVTVGKKLECGPVKNPATIYPNTKGWFNHLNMMVIIPAIINIKAKSLIIDGK